MLIFLLLLFKKKKKRNVNDKIFNDNDSKIPYVFINRK